jgi:uncharacterized protein YbcC (UPF0753/DUF2309 family)
MKTTYEKFIEANNKLSKCFEGVNQERWNKLSANDQNKVCHSEKEAVRSFFLTNQVGFANLLNERIAIVNQ